MVRVAVWTGSQKPLFRSRLKALGRGHDQSLPLATTIKKKPDGSVANLNNSAALYQCHLTPEAPSEQWEVRIPPLLGESLGPTLTSGTEGEVLIPTETKSPFTF